MERACYLASVNRIGARLKPRRLMSGQRFGGRPGPGSAWASLKSRWRSRTQSPSLVHNSVEDRNSCCTPYADRFQ